MEWIELTVRGVDGEVAEALSAAIAPFGYGGAVIERLVGSESVDPPPVGTLAVKVYLPSDPDPTPTIRKLREAIWHLGMILPIPEPELRTLADADWAEAWKSNYTRVRPGGRLIIVPAWDDGPLDDGDLPIYIDPGMAFGTGTHPSTQLSLRLLERHLARGERLLDVGCGSGILSIAAARLGAARVAASDVDPVALAATGENAARNGLTGRIEVREGSASAFEGPFDVVVINILAHIIVTLLPDAVSRLATGGRLILAGIIAEREGLVTASLADLGFEARERLVDGDWVALAATRATER